MQTKWKKNTILEYSRKSKHIQLFHTFFTYEKIPLGYEKQFEINVFWMYNILKFICTQYIPPYLYVLILFIYFFSSISLDHMNILIFYMLKKTVDKIKVSAVILPLRIFQSPNRMIKYR